MARSTALGGRRGVGQLTTHGGLQDAALAGSGGLRGALRSLCECEAVKMQLPPCAEMPSSSRQLGVPPLSPGASPARVVFMARSLLGCEEHIVLKCPHF